MPPRPSPFRVGARIAIRKVAYGLIAAVGLIHRLARPVSRASPNFNPRRILVIRLDLLGDVVFSMNAVQALRDTYPNARITMLVLPYTARLAELYPAIDEVVAIDTNRIRSPRGLTDPRTWISYWKAYTHLRAQHFDLALSLSGPMASLWAFLSGSQRTVGYADEGYPFLLTDPVDGGRYRERMHEVEYVQSLARRAGARSFPGHLLAPVSDSRETRAASLLDSSGIQTTDKLVVMHAGSVNGSAKRWPVAHWARFADEVHRATAAKLTLVGALSDEPIANRIMEAATCPIVSLVGKTDIPELVALLGRADLVATSDSGPLHLAVALGRPLVAVYGPTDPAIHGPYRPTAPVRVHRQDLACSPCYTMAATAECPLGNPICMQLVTVQQMVQSATDLLETQRS